MKTVKKNLRGCVREYPVFDTASQNEALINEFKGNLFEYLVGAYLARQAQCEGDFLRMMDAELLVRLRDYEDWLWQHDENLAAQLPHLAEISAQKIQTHLTHPIERVLVVGKLAGAAHDTSVGEADLLLFSKNNQTTPVSLKLCRRGAYVNTKSAGVRSFLTKYFSGVKSMSLAQGHINLVLDKSFQELARELHVRHGLSEQERFGEDWAKANLPVLPGELNCDDQALLQQHYYLLIQQLYHAFKEAFEHERENFMAGLSALLGFQNDQLIQLTCFHQIKNKQRYELDSIHLVDAKERLVAFHEITISAPKLDQASFALNFPWGVLQIRVKPMNKFIQPALKINCSVRENID